MPSRPTIEFKLTATLAVLCLLLFLVGPQASFGMRASSFGLTAVYGDRIVPLTQIRLIGDIYALRSPLPRTIQPASKGKTRRRSQRRSGKICCGVCQRTRA